jgi:hypothetical protein
MFGGSLRAHEFRIGLDAMVKFFRAAVLARFSSMAVVSGGVLCLIVFLSYFVFSRGARPLALARNRFQRCIVD